MPSADGATLSFEVASSGAEPSALDVVSDEGADGVSEVSDGGGHEGTLLGGVDGAGAPGGTVVGACDVGVTSGGEGVLVVTVGFGATVSIVAGLVPQAMTRLAAP